MLPDLLGGTSEGAAGPSVLAGHQGALTPVPQVVLQVPALEDLAARVRVGTNDGQLVQQSKLSGIIIYNTSNVFGEYIEWFEW